MSKPRPRAVYVDVANRRTTTSIPRYANRCVAEVPSGQKVFAIFLMAITFLGTSLFLLIHTGLLRKFFHLP